MTPTPKSIGFRMPAEWENYHELNNVSDIFINK